MLDIGFVANDSSLAPRPSLLYLEAKMSGGNVSWVDKEAMHSFISLKLTRKLVVCRRVERANSSVCGLEKMIHMI
jgi:hypothetical protein